MSSNNNNNNNNNNEREDGKTGVVDDGKKKDRHPWLRTRFPLWSSDHHQEDDINKSTTPPPPPQMNNRYNNHHHRPPPTIDDVFSSFFGRSGRDNNNNNNNDDFFGNNNNNNINDIRKLEELFERNFPFPPNMMHPPGSEGGRQSSYSYSSSSRTSIQEDMEQVQISMDVPGIGKDDIIVSVAEQFLPSCVVSIEGQQQRRNSITTTKQDDDEPIYDLRRSQKSIQEEKQKRKQLEAMRNQNNNTRTYKKQFRLGTNVECDQLAATLSRGVLHLTVPKKQISNNTITNDDSMKRIIPITEEN